MRVCVSAPVHVLTVFCVLTWGLPCTSTRVIWAAQSATASSSTPDQPALLAGRVVNAVTGLPVPRVLIQAGSRAMLTDHDGRFQFANMTETVSTLMVKKPGFALSPEQLDSASLALAAFPNKSSIEVSIYPDAVLTCTVRGPDGTPLDRIPVTVRRSLFNETGHNLVPMARLQTDSHGSVRAPVLAGDYVVESEFTRLPYENAQVILPSQVPQLSSSGIGGIHLYSGEEVHVDLTPAVAYTHTVTIASTSDRDGSTARIVARSTNGLIVPAGGGGRSRREGRTSLDLPSGTYVLRALTPRAGGEEVGESTVTVADRDVSGVQLHFAQVPPIPIEITLQGGEGSDGQTTPVTPPSPQQLSLSLVNMQDDLVDSPSVQPVMLPDHTPVFRAVPGRYRLRASSNSAWYVANATYGETNLLSQEMIVGPSVGAAPMRITVSKQTGSLNGTVKLAGSPAACWIYLIAADASVAPVSLRHSTTDGTFTFPNAPPGSYRIVSFEHRHSANFLAAGVLASFGPAVESVTIKAGERSSISLDAVPTRELLR